MKWLAESRGSREMGITQVTEILANPGVTYVGPLPGELRITTVYSAGIGSRAQNTGGARDFITRLTSGSARPMLARAGYGFES